MPTIGWEGGTTNDSRPKGVASFAVGSVGERRTEVPDEITVGWPCLVGETNNESPAPRRQELVVGYCASCGRWQRQLEDDDQENVVCWACDSLLWGVQVYEARRAR